MTGTERNCWRSAFLPLHKSLIVAANGVETGIVGAEHDTDDVLGVTTVTSGDALDAGVVEEVDEAIVITSSEHLFVAGAAHGVDMGAIGAAGVDTGRLPKELAGNRGPEGVLVVGTAGWVLVAVGYGEEEELVGTTVGS